MRNNRWRKAVAGAVTTVLLFQATPGGMLTAYAAKQGITVEPKTDELKAELAAKAGDYPAGAFAFYEQQTALKEGDGDREVKIVRWGDTSAEATVDVKVFALTAAYGDDFEVYIKDGLTKNVLEQQAPTAAQEGAASKGAESETATPEAAPAQEEVAPADESKASDDGISAMRESYAIQTGNDTKRTDWRGEYEESLAPVAAVEAANQIADALPGASGTLTFEPGEYVKTVHISVKDDDLAESKEAFKLMLGNASAGVLGEQMQHTVSIEDNEEGEKIAFAMKDAEVTVAADAEYAELTVVRTSGKDYYAGAVVDTAAGTAGPEASYEAMDGVTVPFAAGTTEQVIKVPLKDGAQPGTQFTVRLNADASNVDGAAETVVKIADAAVAPAESDLTAATSEPAPVAMAEQEAAAEPETVAAAPRYEHNGIVFDGVTVNANKRAATRGADATASLDYRNDLSKEATRIIADIHVQGYTDWSFLGKPAYKNWSMAFGGRRMINGRDADSRHHYYTEQFNISYSEGQTGSLWLSVNTDGTNREGIIELNDVTYYFPRFTVEMNKSDIEQTLKGRNYTSTDKYTEFDVSTLTSSWSNTTKTVKRNERADVYPGNVRPGVVVDKYEVYAGDTKVGESKDSTLTYSELSEMRRNHDETLRNAKYKVRVKPVYKTEAATVKFAAQDASAIAFSGDKKGGSGFKVGDVLKATKIDRVTMTAECPTDQNIVPKLITKSSNGAVRDTYRNNGSLQQKVKDVELSYGEQTFTAEYEQVNLTYQYTPSETGAANAGSAAVSIADASNLDKTLGVSNYQQPFTLTGGLDVVASNNYVARVLKGEMPDNVPDAEKNKYFLDGEILGGVPYSTRVIWTYANPKTGQKESVKGLSFVFDPYYGDEVVNYHFKNEQDDIQKAGVKGTVYIQEKPLFSTNAKQTSKAAVGVNVNVGGENVKTDQSGAYRIDAKFNKSDYVSAFLKYDSLTLMENLALSQDTVKDFYIAVDETDAIKVTGASISKLTKTGEKDMSNKDIYEPRNAQSVLLEDAEYTFSVTASGSAGMTPGKAEFYFYDKKGNKRLDKTQTATFENGTATLKINPKQLNLSVGDSMTVKLFDTKGNGYFEHQTSVILGKKASGMYTFNYEGIKQEDDNLFLKVLGGISMGFDFVLDALSANAGTYESEDGNQHQLMFIGFGDGFQNEGPNAEREVYNTMKEAIANIDEVNTGAYKLNSNDSLAFFGDGNWAFDLSIGIIYDMVMEDAGDRKGEFKFSDYLILADASARYNREWEVTLGPAHLTFGLEFSFGDSDNGSDGVSVKWHFYDPDDNGYFVEDNSALALLFDPNLDNEGYFGLDAAVSGSASADFVNELIGAQGGLTVHVGNRVGYDTEKWNDYGEVLLSPEVKLIVLGFKIPVWSQTWRHEWQWNEKPSTAEASAMMMEQLNEGLSPEKVLFASTSEGVQDFSYASKRSGWNAGKGFDLLGMFKNDEPAGESVLQKGFLTDSDISLHDLGGGKYLAAFLDVVPGRDDANKIGAYYTVYDGSAWSKPVLLDDDGTTDQLPTISDAGSKGVLITWSSASKKLDANANLGDRLNALDIEGAFYKDGKLGDVMQITKTTDKDDVADTNPRAVCYTDAAGKQRIKLYYTKSEFSVSNAEEGEVVGDLLNPDQLNLVREYDVEKGAWVDTYDAATEKGIREKLKGDLIAGGIKDPTPEQIDEAYRAYLKSWYGQVFLDLAPAVEVSEKLDEHGRWTETPVITPLDASVASARIVKDSDAISYNGLGLLAYSLDKGGMAQTTGDQNLYLQIFNSASGDYHHPIMISGTNAEVSDIQFVRSTYKAQDGTKPEVTWLYWKEQTTQAVEDENGETVETSVTSIKRMDVSALVRDMDQTLIKDSTTVPGQTFYYIDRSADNEAFSAEQTLVSSTPEAEDGEQFRTIGSFQVKASKDGRYNYVAWTQPVGVGEGENSHQEMQLFVMREDLHSGETTSPVQVTDRADQYLTEFDFAVTEDGNIDVLTGRQFLEEQKIVDEDGKDTGAVEYLPNASTSELAFLQITPSDEVLLDDAVEGDLRVDGDKVLVNLTTSLRNQSFDGVEKVNVEAIDAKGDVVYSSKDEEFVICEDAKAEENGDGVVFDNATEVIQKRGLIDLGGGAVYELPFRVPVDKNGAYNVTLKVTADGKEIASKQVKGQVPVKLTSTGLFAEVAERNKVELTSTIANTAALASGERTVSYGYVNADGEQVELGTKKLKSIEPGSSTEFSVTLDQDFADFASEKREDGSLVDSRTFYLDLEPEQKGSKANAGEDAGVVDEGLNNATVLHGTVELMANAGQVALMGKANDLGAVLAVDDGEGGVKRTDAVKPGEYAEVALTVNGELTQDSEEFINGFKVVWDAVDTPVATVGADGMLKAKKSGKVQLTGKVMPANTASVLGDQAVAEEVDNYDTLPASLIKPVKVTLDIKANGGSGGDGGSGDAGTGGTGGTGSNGAGGSGSTTGGKLPSTGDVNGPVFLIVVTAAGAALVVTGERTRRRTSKKGC